VQTAFAERFVRSVRDECLSNVIPLGGKHLRELLREYGAHYHGERNHQGVANTLIDPSNDDSTMTRRVSGASASAACSTSTTEQPREHVGRRLTHYGRGTSRQVSRDVANLPRRTHTAIEVAPVPMTIAVVCSALLGLLLFGLGCAITMQRRRSATYFGYREHPSDPLYRLVRAHGNTAEYAALLCVLMLLSAERNPAPWVQLVMIAATASRYCQVTGMLLRPSPDNRPNVFRIVGTLGTYVGGLLLSIAILLTAA
jgi:uncharacterized membrane protein YecN with MAPEG domain